jgi:HEAT repeat protein
LTQEGAEQEGFDWQISHLAALEESLAGYLRQVPAELADRLASAPGPEQHDILLALNDLRAETAAAVLPLLETPRFGHADIAVETLTWSRDRRVGPYLRHWAGRRLPLLRRAQRRKRALPPRRSSVPADLPYPSILRALRGHAAAETEAFLLVASRDWDPTYRTAAVSSLGWWEPIRRREMLACLQLGRRDPNPEVRQAARAALARLGERQALQAFRQGLQSDDIPYVLETLMVIANEGLTLLWPDLDKLADTGDTDVGHHAREALERLSEDMESGIR